MVSLHLAVTVTDDDHAQGPADAPYLLVQYGDYGGGVQSGVGGTPTFFTNGVRHEGPYAAAALLAALRATTLTT